MPHRIGANAGASRSIVAATAAAAAAALFGAAAARSLPLLCRRWRNRPFLISRDDASAVPRMPPTSYRWTSCPWDRLRASAAGRVGGVLRRSGCAPLRGVLRRPACILYGNVKWNIHVELPAQDPGQEANTLSGNSRRPSMACATPRSCRATQRRDILRASGSTPAKCIRQCISRCAQAHSGSACGRFLVYRWAEGLEGFFLALRRGAIGRNICKGVGVCEREVPPPLAASGIHSWAP